MLSELRVKTSGENTFPPPFWNWIGIVLPENSISPVAPTGIVYIKSESSYTSI
jgi:hypothetical protein